MTEINKNPMPDIKLFEFRRVREVADIISGVLHLVFDQIRGDVKPYQSDHYRPPHEIKDGAHIHRINRTTDWHRPQGW